MTDTIEERMAKIEHGGEVCSERSTITGVVTATTSDTLITQAFTMTITPTHDGPTGWRVLTFNCNRYREGQYLNQKLAEFLSEYDPDIICLNEFPERTIGTRADSISKLAELVTLLGFDGYVYGSTHHLTRLTPAGNTSGGYFNNAVLYRGTLLDSGSTIMNAYNTGSDGDSRSYCWAKVKNSDGKSGTFISTHLSGGSQVAGSTGAGSIARTAQVAEIAAFTSTRPGLVVIGGDFNHTTTADSYALAATHWTNCFNKAVNSGATYTTASDVRDYVYFVAPASGISACTAVHIIDDDTLSDHRAVYADVVNLDSAELSGHSGSIWLAIGRNLGRTLY